MIFELVGENPALSNRFLFPFALTYMVISLTFCGFLIILGRRISHRNAGPIYAFDKYVNDLLDGRNRRFKLRSGDEFRELEALGLKLAEYLLENNLIDHTDEIKILTTQPISSEDFSLPAVPADEQLPDYRLKSVPNNENLKNVLFFKIKKEK